MAARGSRNEEEDEEEQVSSDEERSSNSDGSSDGSDGSSDNESDDASEEDDGVEDHELKQARVRGDIQEMQLMVGEMEKIKQRLLFRLEREKQAKLEEANWQKQQQQLAAEEQERQLQQQREEEWQRRQLQQQREEAEKKAREADQTPQDASEQQKTLPERSLVEIGVQTELDTAHAERDNRVISNVVQQAPRSMDDLSQRQTANTSQQASVPAEGQTARLSLYDLGKSYGLKETRVSPSNQESTHQERPNRPAQASPASAARRVPAPPSEASDADTFFIRRDSNRTSWQPDGPNHNNDSFHRSQGSALGSEYSENDHPGSPTAQAGAHTEKSAFDTLRNTILSSIREGAHSDNAASVAPSKLFESQRSRMGSALSSAAKGDGERVAKTDEQREQEAIQSLLFSR
ncbi:hypothetical protein Gpo141_00009667 [Globisporangium polare]